jgi:hypothetical protein
MFKEKASSSSFIEYVGRHAVCLTVVKLRRLETSRVDMLSDPVVFDMYVL